MGDHYRDQVSELANLHHLVCGQGIILCPVYIRYILLYAQYACIEAPDT